MTTPLRPISRNMFTLLQFESYRYDCSAQRPQKNSEIIVMSQRDELKDTWRESEAVSAVVAKLGQMLHNIDLQKGEINLSHLV